MPQRSRKSGIAARNLKIRIADPRKGYPHERFAVYFGYRDITDLQLLMFVSECLHGIEIRGQRLEVRDQKKARCRINDFGSGQALEISNRQNYAVYLSLRRASSVNNR